MSSVNINNNNIKNGATQLQQVTPESKPSQKLSDSKLVIKKTIKTIHDYTKTGFQGYGVKKVNQDNFFIQKNFCGISNHYFMGVW
jgi:hypothetical protein